MALFFANTQEAKKKVFFILLPKEIKAQKNNKSRETFFSIFILYFHQAIQLYFWSPIKKECSTSIPVLNCKCGRRTLEPIYAALLDKSSSEVCHGFPIYILIGCCTRESG